MNSRYTFRILIWTFMTVVAGYMLFYTIAHHGDSGKIALQTILFAIGIIMCIVIYASQKKGEE